MNQDPGAQPVPPVVRPRAANDTFSLLPRQKLAVKAVINKKHCLIVLPPGQGKTAIALGLLKVRWMYRKLSTATILTHKRGVEAYRKLTAGLPLTYIESADDLLGLDRMLDEDPSRIFVVNTGLFPRVASGKLASSKAKSLRKRVRAPVLDTDADYTSVGPEDYPDAIPENDSSQAPGTAWDALLGRHVAAGTPGPQDDPTLPDPQRGRGGRNLGALEREGGGGKEVSGGTTSPTTTKETTAMNNGVSRERVYSSSLTPSSPESVDLTLSLLRLINLSTQVIIDEVHNYRVYDSATSAFLISLLRDYKGIRTGISATPLYKNLEDMYQAIDLVSPYYLGTYTDFRNNFCEVETLRVPSKRWINTPWGMRRAPGYDEIPTVVGYKNQELFWQAIDPILYKDLETDFTISWAVHSYEIEDWEAYDREIRGLEFGKACWVSCVPEFPTQTTVKKKFNPGETVYAIRGAETLHLEPIDLLPGDLATVAGKTPLKVISVKPAESERDIIARIAPLEQYLSRLPAKRQVLYRLLDQVAPDRGALVFVRYLDIIDELLEDLSARYPGRRVHSIQGGETDMAGRLADCGPSDFVLISQVAFQSLDFYYDTLISYESIRLPGPLEQLVGRITRVNSPFRSISIHIIAGMRTIEHYFHQRLIYLAKDSQLSTYDLPELAFPGVSVFDDKASLSTLKEILLWGKGTKRKKKPTNSK